MAAMSLVVIPRAPDGVDYGGPLGWSPVNDRSGVIKASVCCPNGHLMALKHNVAADGTVSPSIVCTGWAGGKPGEREPCDWHVFARLEGWTP